jgi:DNA-directed RNA polymerase specialized sigma24 family protein
VACVVGELKRFLRDTSWRLHVPRPLKERALRLCRAADELHQRMGRSPTTGDLAEHLEVGEEEVLGALMVVSSRWELSLDQPAGGETDLSLGDLVAAPEAREEPEDLLALPGLVSALPELEREVIVLRFFEDLDQDTIAAPGWLLADARLPHPATGPGPAARSAGGTLTDRPGQSIAGRRSGAPRRRNQPDSLACRNIQLLIKLCIILNTGEEHLCRPKLTQTPARSATS